MLPLPPSFQCTFFSPGFFSTLPLSGPSVVAQGGAGWVLFFPFPQRLFFLSQPRAAVSRPPVLPPPVVPPSFSSPFWKAKKMKTRTSYGFPFPFSPLSSFFSICDALKGYGLYKGFFSLPFLFSASFFFSFPPSQHDVANSSHPFSFTDPPPPPPFFPPPLTPSYSSVKRKFSSRTSSSLLSLWRHRLFPSLFFSPLSQ